jgi:hypothetical protein
MNKVKSRRDLNPMLEETLRGNSDFRAEIVQHLITFPCIILRGAGNFGRELLALLLELGVKKETILFWDMHAQSMKEIEGVPVLLPFSESIDVQNTLVIHAIRTALPEDAEDYTVHGILHYLQGLTLRNLLVCPLYIGSENPLLCQKNHPHCIFCRCPKALGKQYHFTPNKGLSPDELIVDNISFNVNQKCTLKCKNCVQYINHYASYERINFPEERIKKDINRFFAAHDFIRLPTLIGGELFLHPEAHSIIKHILKQRNFGVLRIITNGVCKISPEALHAMMHERCLVEFSDYSNVLTQKQKTLFDLNYEKIAHQGIRRHILFPNEWRLPSTLQPMGYSVTHMQNLKATCHLHQECRQVINGIYYPCIFSANLNQHHLADYPTDKVMLDQGSIAELRARIIECNQRSFYASCNHCNLNTPHCKPGEQGFEPRYSHIGAGVASATA